jgi:renalase
MKRIAIIGAGIAGASCAGILAAADCEVTLFDKARGAGGRLATRRLDAGWATLGCPFLQAVRAPFAQQLQAWRTTNWIAPVEGVVYGNSALGWTRETMTQQYRSLVEPSRLVRQLAGDARLRFSAQVTHVDADTIMLADGESISGFDQVIVSVPAPQAAVLLADYAALQAQLAGVQYQPLWTFLMRWDGGVAAEAIRFDDSLLQLAVRQGFAGAGVWAVQATPLFSTTYLDASLEEVTTRAASALVGLVGLSQPIDVIAAHRWLYAMPIAATTCSTPDTRWLWDKETGVAVIGDGVSSGTLEGAWESGVQFAAMWLAANGIDPAQKASS